MSARRATKPPKLSLISEWNTADIPGQLRGFAQAIEDGDISAETVVCVVETANGVAAHGWGKVDGLRAIGLLSLGSAWLNKHVLDALEGET